MKQYLFACVFLSASVYGTAFKPLGLRMRAQLDNLLYVVSAALPPTIFAGSWYGERQVNAQYKAMKLVPLSIYDKQNQEAHKLEMDRLRFKRTILRGVRNVSGVITAFEAGAYIMGAGLFSLVGL